MASNRITIMEGNTPKLRYTYREDGHVAYIPEGYSLIAGLYTPKGQLVLSGRYPTAETGEIQITPDEHDDYLYLMELSHEQTVGLTGAYVLEVSVVDDALEDVSHVTSTVILDFVKRDNNKLLNKKTS